MYYNNSFIFVFCQISLFKAINTLTKRSPRLGTLHLAFKLTHASEKQERRGSSDISG